MKIKQFHIMAFFISAVFFFGGMIPKAFSHSKNAAEVYQYEDTRQLVELVIEAGKLFEQIGPAAFESFKEQDSKWFNNQHYLFVYNLLGNSIFHPVEPELVGKNLMNFGRYFDFRHQFYDYLRFANYRFFRDRNT